MQHVSKDLEAAIIGGILSNDAGATWVSRLTPEDFGVPQHRQIFAEIEAIARAGGTPKVALLIHPLQTQGINVGNGVSIAQYLTSTFPRAVPNTHMADALRALKELSGRRVLRGLSEQIAAAADDTTHPLSDTCGWISGIMADIASSTRQDRRTSFDACEARNVVSAIERRDKENTISTALVDVDQRTGGGLRRRETLVVAGRPSMGKTALLASMIRQTCRKKGHSALFFSLEMPHEAMMHRMLSDDVWNQQTAIPYRNMRGGEFDAWQIERLREAADRIAQCEMRIDDGAGLTTAEIAARVKRYQDELAKRGRTLDIVAVDHIGKMRATDHYRGNRVHETGEKMNDLTVIAKDCNVAMVVASQLSRAGAQDGERPELHHLRDSGDIEQDADMVWFPFRPAYKLERTKGGTEEKERDRLELLDACRTDLELIIAKQRNGPCGPVDLFIDLASNAVRDAACRG